MAERHPVLPRVGAADQHAALPVDADRLAAAVRRRRALDDVAAAFQVLRDALGDRRLEAQGAAVELAAIGEGARRLGGLLRIAAEVEDLAGEMRVADRL